MPFNYFQKKSGEVIKLLEKIIKWPNAHMPMQHERRIDIHFFLTELNRFYNLTLNVSSRTIFSLNLNVLLKTLLVVR